MALPDSGILSASMINIETGNIATSPISFSAIATDFVLSAPNYGDSNLGFSISELYGLSPTVTAIFEDFGVSSFAINSQTGQVTSPSVATTGADPVPSVTSTYLPSGLPYGLVFSSTTRQANVSLTVPATNHLGNNYANQGATLTGTVGGNQPAYEFDPSTDWTGRTVFSINPNTGELSRSTGTDGDGPHSSTYDTTFTEVADDDFGNLEPGEIRYSSTNFGVRTSGGTQTQTCTVTFGVPSDDKDANGGKFGNYDSSAAVANTETFQKTGITHHIKETITSNPTGSTTNGVDLLWAYNDTSTKQIQVNGSGGTGTVTLTGTILSGFSEGSPSSVYYIHTDSSFPIETFSHGDPSSPNSDVFYVKPASQNNALSSRDARIIFSGVYGGEIATVLIRQVGNVIFNVSPAAGSSIAFASNGSLKSGDNTIDLTTNSAPDEISWVANVTGSRFSVSPTTGTGNATITVSCSAPTPALPSSVNGTLNIDATTEGVTGVLKSFSLAGDALDASGNVYYQDGSSVNVAIGGLTPSVTIDNIGSPNYNPSPAFHAIKIVANYAVSFTAFLDNSSVGELDSNYDLSGNPSGGSLSFSGTSRTSTSDSVNFFVNFKKNITSSDNSGTVTIQFGDSTSNTNTSIQYTVEGTGGGSGPGGGGNGGGGAPPI